MSFRVEIPEKGAVNGHVKLLAPKEEMVPSGFCANLIASLLFERMHAQGTNIVINVENELTTHILSRAENDGLELVWQPKEFEPERMDEIQSRIRDKTFMVGKEAPPQPEKKQEAPLTPEEEDYLAKQLIRVP